MCAASSGRIVSTLSLTAAISAVLVLCELRSAAARPPLLSLSLEGSVVGNGQTPVRVRITVKPAAALKANRRIRISTSAGTITEPQMVADGAIASFTPPAVANRETVTITAEMQIGKRTVAASKSVPVDALPDPKTPAVTDSPAAFSIIPETLMLGRDVSAQVTVKMPHDEPVRMVTSLGRISSAKSLADGRFAATYIPPEQLYPQAAIIVAIGERSGAFAWTAIPLFGKGSVPIWAKKGQQVRLKVGERSVGPFLAARDGELSVGVAAPPGVISGTSTVIDVDGSSKEAEVDLAAPEFRRLLLVCPDASEVVRIFVIDAHGQPATTERLIVDVDRGLVSSPRPVAKGVFESDYAPPADGAVGATAKVTAKIVDDAASISTCSLSIRGGPPAHLTLSFEPNQYVAATNTPVTVTLVALDAAGRPTSASSPTLAADFGNPDTPTEVAPGIWRAAWTVANEFRERRRAFVRAQCGAAVTEAGLALVPGRTARLMPRIDAKSLRADGRSTGTLSVRAEDAYGNAVAKTALSAASAGWVTPLSFAESEGSFVAAYTTPLLYEPTQDVITVRDEAADAVASVSLPLTPSRRPFAIGVKGGYGLNFGKVRAPLVGLDASLRLRPVSESLLLGIEATFSPTSASTADADSSLLTKTEVWIAPALAHASLEASFEGWALYAGILGGAALVGVAVSGQSIGRRTWTGAEPAFGGRAGVDFSLGRGRFALEAAYLYADANLGVVRGNVGGLRAALAYRFEP